MKKINVPFHFPFEITKKIHQSDEKGNWYVEGFASTSDFDLQSDMIEEEAFKKARKDLLERNTVLFNHDPNMPIGKVTKAETRKDGLWIRVMISKTAPDIWKKIQEGIISKFSIRGKILVAVKRYIKKLGRIANVIKEMDLIECSLVALPANPQAKTTRWYIAKAMSKALEEFEAKGGEIPAMEFKNTKEALELLDKVTDRLTEDEDKTLAQSIKSFLSIEIDKAEKEKETKKAEEVKKAEEAKKAEEDKKAEEEEAKKKKAEEDKKAAEAKKAGGKEEESYPKKKSGELWTQEDVDRLIDDLEKFKKKDEHPYPKKKSGEFYSQEEIDVMVKELEDLTKSKAKTDEELTDIKAEAEVEKKWNEIGSQYEDSHAKEVKGILKKSILGKPLTTEETLALITKRKKESSLPNSSIPVEFVKGRMTDERKLEIIKQYGIKSRIKT